MSNKPEYGAERGTPLPVDRLTRYLEQAVPELKAPIDVKQFKFGQSNPTYLLRDAFSKRYVLRKKPPGQLLSKTAHAVDREYRIYAALNMYNAGEPDERWHVPVPKVYCFCEDESVVGTQFYVMEFLDGRIFTDVHLPELNPSERREVWRATIDVLARLSRVPLSPDLTLDTWGPSTPFYPRQLRSFSRIEASQAEARDVDSGEVVGHVPGWDGHVKWFEGWMLSKEEEGRCVVHGDYKLDNLMFHPTTFRIIGVLDWELSTTGSPLSDLANLLIYTPFYTAPSPQGLAAPHPHTDIGVSIEDLVKQYCDLTGRPYPLRGLQFAIAWNALRTCVIAQGIGARHYRRQASSEHALEYLARLPELAKRVGEAQKRHEDDMRLAGAEGGKSKL